MGGDLLVQGSRALALSRAGLFSTFVVFVGVMGGYSAGSEAVDCDRLRALPKR